jgi:cation-transporting ATPase 13A3/4/5
MARKFEDKPESAELIQISSNLLVPGDVIKVPEGLVLPCDLVLMTGSAIVNESILTGESIPVIKQSLPIVNSEVYTS